MRDNGRYIFRCDDVSQNTDIKELHEIYEVIKESGLPFDFWSCVSPIVKRNEEGSVYPNPPFKDRDRNFFYDADICGTPGNLPGRVVSHGLLHFDHRGLQYDAQEMSIVTSCNILKTNIFVPPFNWYDQVTENVCRINNIDLVKIEEGWLNLDHQPFDPIHKLWYFHPWRQSPEGMEASLNLGLYV